MIFTKKIAEKIAKRFGSTIGKCKLKVGLDGEVYGKLKEIIGRDIFGKDIVILNCYSSTIENAVISNVVFNEYGDVRLGLDQVNQIEKLTALRKKFATFGVDIVSERKYNIAYIRFKMAELPDFDVLRQCTIDWYSSPNTTTDIIKADLDKEVIRVYRSKVSGVLSYDTPIEIVADYLQDRDVNVEPLRRVIRDGLSTLRSK